MKIQSPATNHPPLVTNHQSPANAIVLSNVSKKYILTKQRPVLLKNLFLPQKREEKWALKDVSLTIKKGGCIGIIGENGSGKSTLLKIISGITTPTTGKIEVNGRIASLIELGAGFHPDLTGRENVYLNGTLLGLTKNEIDKKFKDIIEFADIGEYINQPVRTYSSGMTVRLGFSVAIHLDPEILLIDEVLAVGDILFQKKCIDIINSYKNSDKTIFFVSHNLGLISQLCSKSIFIHNGQLALFDHTEKVIKTYLNIAKNNFPQPLPPTIKKKWGNNEAIIKSIQILNIQKKETSNFLPGEKIIIKVKVKFFQNIFNPVFGITIKDSQSNIIFFTNTHLLGINTGKFNKGVEKMIEYFINENFEEGKYYISPAIAAEDISKFYNWKENYSHFFIKNNQNNKHNLINIRIY